MGCFENKRAVDWGLVFADQDRRMVFRVGGSKPSALSPFFVHLYRAMECLDEEEVR